ncbi:hypothetical protein [Loktanella sp. Alg231-35]|uniref:hypothetical protein n=1 Tax=Loktanella sp. Alg231-35 TaxID=1922220 RepID=UPI000D552353|nr:hypothetical protein [Loktanella sp. Alg231-35]
MSDQSTIFDDLIDAFFRPIMTLFGGMFLGYGAQLAALSHWAVAATVLLGAVAVYVLPEEMLAWF